MKVSKVIAKIEKRLGQKGIVTRRGHKFFVQHEGYVASFYGTDDGCSGHFCDRMTPEELDASSFHVRSENDHTDLQTDYFAGSYLSNASQMVDWLSPPGSKFGVGQLVRAKDTKRMKRYGLTGQTGIVIEAGRNKSSKVKWTNPSIPNFGHLADRDLELLSAG